jgi:hypothetical protein
MFFFSPDQGLVEHILVDISWIIVVNYVKRKNKVMLDEKMSKVAKGERKTKEKQNKRIEKKSVPLGWKICFLRFYVDGA